MSCRRLWFFSQGLLDGGGHLLHQPLGRGGGPANANGTRPGEQRVVYLVRAVYQVGVGVDLQALREEHLAVGAFLAADKEDEVVPGGEAADVGYAVGHLPADGVVVLEGGLGRDVRLDVVHNMAELVQRLGGLRVEAYALAEVQLGDFLQLLYDDGLALRLAHEAQHLGMAVLAVDDDLLVLPSGVMLLLDAFLQFEHHGAGGVYDFYVVAAGRVVGFGRFAVGAQQDFGVVQAGKLFVVDGDEAHGLEAFHLAAVVHDVTQAVERAALAQFFLGLAYGVDHAEAESGAAVYLYCCHATLLYCSSSHSFCWAMVMWLLSSTRASSAWRRGLTARVRSMRSRSCTLASISS